MTHRASHRTRFGTLLVAAGLLSAGLAFGVPTASGAVNAHSTSVQPMALNAPVVGIAATKSGGGYWRAAADGAVLAAGNAVFYGSMGGVPLHRPIVGMAPTPDSKGYWLVASDGGIFAFGNAKFHGSTGGMRLNQPIVGMASTPDGKGYWLVASDGGIFAFGNAKFYGSTGSMRLNRPIVGMASTKNGGGYWLVASDGGIFAFGNAKFYGSTGSMQLARPITGMAAVPSGAGYMLVAADGGVFLFGAVTFYGSAAGACPGAIAVGVATSSGATGYWITFSDARTYAFSPSSKPPTCGPTGTSKPELAASDIFKRLNDERMARGFAPLTWNSQLASYATAWSADMAVNGFRHSNIGNLLGPFNYVGENIAMGSAGITAGTLHVSWMHSQGHRTNILAPGFNSVGVGVYCAPNGSMWATQVFGRTASSGSPPATPTPPLNPVVRSDPGASTC
jgi:uncharacterized protein YkwD/ribosomal protein L24E